MSSRPVTSEEIESAFSGGLKVIEQIASAILPIEPDEEFTELQGGHLRIRPYAVTWVYEQKDPNGRWTVLGWGKTGAIHKTSKVLTFSGAGTPQKRTLEDVPAELTLANKKSWNSRPKTD